MDPDAVEHTDLEHANQIGLHPRESLHPRKEADEIDHPQQSWSVDYNMQPCGHHVVGINSLQHELQWQS